jgi:hypothetical protein
MTAELYNSSIAVVATEDLTGAKHKAVLIAGTIAQAASYKMAAGICKTAPGSGYNTQVVLEGVTKVYMGAVVTTPGWPLKVANSGFLTPCASGDMAVGRYLGTAACASGDIVEAGIDFRNLSFWGG